MKLRLSLNFQLIPLLESALASGRSHVLSCVLCSAKGFICEFCGHNKPVYPFDLELVSQCSRCFQVFHADCASTRRNCPRCERRAARDIDWCVREAMRNRTMSAAEEAVEAKEEMML